MNTIKFEITSKKTIVIATGKLGNVENIDITDTEIEKDFTVLLKKLSEYWKDKQVFDAIDIDSWTNPE